MQQRMTLLALALIATFTAPAALAQDAVVPDDFGTIGAALLGAADGDGDGTIEILVRAGTYVENVAIRRHGVALSGEGAASTTIQGLGNIDTVTLRANSAVIEGFTIVATPPFDGLNVPRSSGSTVQGNVFSGGESGIRLRLTEAMQLLDNEVTGTTQEGIKMEGSRNALLLGNWVHDNAGEGIDMRRARRCRLQSNLVENNGSNGIRDRGGARNDLIGNQSLNNGDNGIFLRNSRENTLDGNTASSNVANGMRMRDTASNLITGNSFTGNQEFGVRRRDWTADDFDAGAAGAQDPPGDNDLSGNGNGELRED